jgi:hypothetical protein
VQDSNHEAFRRARRVARVADEPRLCLPPLVEVAIARRCGQIAEIQFLSLALDLAEARLRRPDALVGDGALVLHAEPLFQVRAPRPDADERNGQQQCRDDRGCEDDPFPGLHRVLSSVAVEIVISRTNRPRNTA